ncbi:recombinase family protein [Paraeggerthella sp.]|uniref:recombinase family protein n=1 Tax=Paraeggerthella sp. TaxID=2897350 RepID=UPI003AB611E7
MYSTTRLPASGRYAMLLRKSREDMEAERIGKFETLARHEAELYRLADSLGIKVAKVFRELVSGDSLQDRETMRELLGEVMQNAWDGVLAIDMQRVTRGDMVDQGTIMAAFKYTRTLIVTPGKIYDPADENDEDTMEVHLMVGRIELKMIKKRLQEGRVRSVHDGQYVGSFAPFGWDKATIDRKHTLVPNADNPAMVQMYRDVASRARSVQGIADDYNARGVPSPRNRNWDQSTVRRIIRNPANKGYVRWFERKQVVEFDDGMKRRKTRVLCPEKTLIVKGLHEGTVPEDLWQAANDVIAYVPQSREPNGTKLRNPLAGLLVCKGCGRSLQTVHSNKQPRLRYQHPKSNKHECWAIGAYFDDVIPLAISALEAAAHDVEASIAGNDGRQVAASERLKVLETDERECRNALANLMRLAEKGLISDEEFAERKAVHDERLARTLEQTDAARFDAASAPRKREQVVRAKEAIASLSDYEGREKEVNGFLKTLVDRIEYEKDPRTGEIRLGVYLK